MGKARQWMQECAWGLRSMMQVIRALTIRITCTWSARSFASNVPHKFPAGADLRERSSDHADATSWRLHARRTSLAMLSELSLLPISFTLLLYGWRGMILWVENEAHSVARPYVCPSFIEYVHRNCTLERLNIGKKRRPGWVISWYGISRS